jgi:hypothetical protein
LEFVAVETIQGPAEAVNAEREVDGMNGETIYKALFLFIYFGIPFLYVWKVRHPAVKIWEAYARFLIILYGSLLIGGIFVGYLISYGIEGAHGISTAVTNGIIAFLMGSLASIGFYLARKRIQIAPRDYLLRSLDGNPAHMTNATNITIARPG